MTCRIGNSNTVEEVVAAALLASRVGSGDADVLATPSLVALMEKAAFSLLRDALPPGETSVGTAIDIAHTRPTPVGMRVWVRAELTAMEGRHYRFRLTAWDEAGPVGEGTHERCQVTAARFRASAEARRGQ